MAIRQDNADLPRGETEGNPPDAVPRFGQLLAEAWGAMNDEHYHVKSRTDVDRYIRLGWGGKCARDIGYRLLEVEPTNPSDLAGEWRMGLGTMVHELLQEAVRRAFPGAEIEKVVGAEHDEIMGLPTSGRTDLFIVQTDEVIGRRADELLPGEAWGDCEGERLAVHPKRVAVEIKTINGFGFKMAVGARGVPEGPRTGALFQAALNGRAHGADEVVVLVLSLECLSDRELDSLVKKQGGAPDSWRKFLAEWTYPMSALDEMVDRELKRLGKIVKMTDDVMASMAAEEPLAPLPPRSIPLEMPARGRVTDPSTGAWQTEIEGNVMDAGKTWMCGYCDYRDRCIADGPS